MTKKLITIIHDKMLKLSESEDTSNVEDSKNYLYVVTKSKDHVHGIVLNKSTMKVLYANYIRLL